MENCVVCGKEYSRQAMKKNVRTKGSRAIVEYYCPDCVWYMEDRDKKILETMVYKTDDIPSNNSFSAEDVLPQEESFLKNKTNFKEEAIPQEDSFSLKMKTANPGAEELEQCLICKKMFSPHEIRARVDVEGYKAVVKRYCEKCYETL